VCVVETKETEEMTQVTVLILSAGVLAICPAAVKAADDDPHGRHGMEIPVEGPLRRVRAGDVAWPRNFRPVDDEGWSVFRATADTRICYVSSRGDDASAVVYDPGDPAVGPDPFNPAGPVKAFGDINTALKRQRPGKPDWVLLRRGDTWRGPVTEPLLPPGRSAAEPRLIGAYGPLSRPRPRIVGRGAGFRVGHVHAGVQHLAIVGIEFYASWKDPKHADWKVDLKRLEGHRGHDYIKALAGKHRCGISWANNDRRGKPMENVLIEDCLLRFCPLSGTNFGATMTNVVARRNVIVDHYPLRGHTTGLWNSCGSLRLEENIVDHCGWYNQRGKEPKIGWAIPLSHNLYYSKCWNTALVRNLWLRSASIGNKFRGDYLRSIGNLLLADNFFLDGELGPGISGNYPGPYRNVNVIVVNNVLADIGRSRPTNRSLGWYMPLADWDGGHVAHNLLVRKPNGAVTNVFGITMRASEPLRDRKTGRTIAKGPGSLHGRTRNVNLFGNVVYALGAGKNHAALELLGAHAGAFGNVRVTGNRLQAPSGGETLVIAETLEGVTFEGNTYFAAGAEAPFRLGAGKAQRAVSFEQWTAKTGEKNARFAQADFPDPKRTVEAYMRTLGYKGDDEQLYATFFAEARTMRRGAWRKAFTAQAINDYFRKGFALKRIDPDTLPPVQCGPFEPRFSYRSKLEKK